MSAFCPDMSPDVRVCPDWLLLSTKLTICIKRDIWEMGTKNGTNGKTHTLKAVKIIKRKESSKEKNLGKKSQDCSKYQTKTGGGSPCPLDGRVRRLRKKGALAWLITTRRYGHR